ncbi:MAG: hypothetical protein CM1200mP41_26450 [Gammaproteobacteria bacterium]|nr:MAG: hypothetical protein CM1200mP41_26450 [Gammaproteobacteria bacterium]
MKLQKGINALALLSLMSPSCQRESISIQPIQWHWPTVLKGGRATPGGVDYCLSRNQWTLLGCRGSGSGQREIWGPRC